ncbi:MAG: hypothetical protein HRT73_08095 [Flavobacteriales bacterium]|nr:hypothetical protein [Flavobacteriales bacterium]NQX97825.1 hypothetical protein [Flavobacteriales bacterium]
MKGLFFNLTVMILLFGCKTAEEVKADTTLTGKRYAIGQGGGFTGKYSEFILSEDGKVHKYDFNNGREVFFKDLNKSDLVYFLEKIEALGLEGMELNQPGNITKYIDVRIGKTSINKIVWGNYQYNADQELKDFHKELYDKLKDWD